MVSAVLSEVKSICSYEKKGKCCDFNGSCGLDSCESYSPPGFLFCFFFSCHCLNTVSQKLRRNRQYFIDSLLSCLSDIIKTLIGLYGGTSSVNSAEK